VPVTIFEFGEFKLDCDRFELRRAGRTVRCTSNIQSIAVLTLDNLSGDPSQNNFADGLTEEFTTTLAKNATLDVISRTSTMQYKGALSGLCSHQSLHLRSRSHLRFLEPEARDPDQQGHVVNRLEADLQSRPVLEIAHKQQQGVDP
jgi:hypothetical protein